MNTYDDELHEYRIDGVVVPSVTTILQAAGLYDDTWFTESARARGKYIHTAVLYYLQDDLVEDSIPEEYRGYIAAFKSFMADTGFQADIQNCEKPVYMAIYGYAGTPDLVGYMNDCFTLIDIKTGAETPTTGIQLAAYEQLIGSPIVSKRHGLYLKDTGKYKLIQYTDRNDLKLFNASLSLYHWRQKEVLLK